MIAQCPAPCQDKSFANTGRKLLKTRNETFPAVRHPTWKLELVPNVPLATVGIKSPKKEGL